MGESPSKYSRSPAMWNAAFGDIGLDAVHCPFDVRPENLAGFVEAARAYPGFMGSNVTVPHKLAIMPLLDEIDPIAREIGAVNTFMQTEDGRLVGFNTDADGLVASMLRTLPGQSEPFLPTLVGQARAAAWARAARAGRRRSRWRRRSATARCCSRTARWSARRSWRSRRQRPPARG